MQIDLVSRVLVWALTAWACFWAPGQAILLRSPSGLPRAFSQVLASTVVTTLVATGLAAFERFSLPSLLICNAAIAAGVLLARCAAGSLGAAGRSPARRDVTGVCVFALALATYWPAYPVFLGMSDSTMYVSSGISLARNGTLAIEDELAPTLSPSGRRQLFDTMSQIFASTGPPYRRMPGGVMIESHDSERAWPCFFPVPAVWAAVFASAGAPGAAHDEEAAPAFAPVFAALSLWAFWHLARSWLGGGFGLLAVVLLAASAPFYYAARLPLAEPIAAFLGLSGLAILAMASSRLPTRDAVLAGAALGAAVFARAEEGLFLAFAFAVAPALLPRAATIPAAGGPALPPAAFFLSFGAVASLVVAEIVLIPGSYVSPLLDQPHNAWVVYKLRYGAPGVAGLAGAVAASIAVLAFLASRFGWSATLRWGFVIAVLAAHASASRFLYERTPMWLSFSIGWAGLLMAFAGAALAWRGRARLAGAPVLLGVAAAAVTILFYNPHVYPTLPWGARRYVPLLLPMLVLLATYTVARAAERSRLLALACAAVLVFGVAAGGRPVWGKNLVEGAWQQLEAVSAAIPRDGIVLLDRETSPLMLGPALWLIHERNSLPVPSITSAAGRSYVPQMVWYYARRGTPLYYVTRGAGNQIPAPKMKMTLIGRETVALRFLEQTYDRRPEKIERYLMPLAVYRLDVSLSPRGEIVKAAGVE